jgi:hypothetical protein
MIYDDCFLLSLANGIELLAEVIVPSTPAASIDGSTVIKNPVIIEPVLSKEKPNQVGVQFRPFSFFLEPEAPTVLNDKYILARARPSKEIFAQYNQMFGSAIVIPELNPPKGPLKIVK